ncbi:MFS transporter [Desulfatirhabdium butyrativorans]|uniref:MFS transporter n=1 Tax=Desulfatirhabdium butyrativorans TaxID=340467 RepID=UPI0003FA11C3|nr:MFS transporter [Desulfatirhabdium butyrativorans]
MREATERSIQGYRWAIFWVLSFGYILVYFHRLCPAVVALDMMRDLNTGPTLTGFLASAYFYPYAIMQLPAGLLADSWGPRNTITVFFGIACIGSIMLGLAHTTTIAIFGRTLVGLGVAMFFVPTLKIFSQWFEAKSFAHLTGILMAMGGIGSLTSATPLVWLSSAVGWRMSFVGVGIATIVLGILVWIIVRDQPSDKGWPNVVPAAGSGKTEAIPLLAGLKRVLMTRSFWPLCIWFFFVLGVFFSVGGLWGGPYLRKVYHLDPSEAGHILSMIAIGMIFGSPFLSHLSTKVFRARKPVLVLSSAIVVAIVLLFTLFTATLPIWVLYLQFLGLGVFASAIVVIGFTAAKESFPVNMAGTATGVVNLFPFAGGAVLQPLAGYVIEMSAGPDAAAFGRMFALMLACAVIGFLASTRIRETLSASM